jgi:hypothetical protein
MFRLIFQLPIEEHRVSVCEAVWKVALFYVYLIRALVVLIEILNTVRTDSDSSWFLCVSMRIFGHYSCPCHDIIR